MKTKIFIIVSLLLMLTSCEKIDLNETTASSTTTKQSKEVQFVMTGITESYTTRATITSVGCTDLWVFEDTTLLAHKVSTDEDFETPKITLNYGSHDLTFIASDSKDQSFLKGV